MRYWWIPIVVVVVIAATVGIVWAIRYYTAPIEGRVGAQERIQSAPNRIVQYDHFFNLCAGVRADEVSLDAQTEQLKATTDEFQRARVQTNITGLIGHRAGLIEEYNANARKDYTAGQFRDSDLPYQIPATAWEKGGRTSCGK